METRPVVFVSLAEVAEIYTSAADEGAYPTRAVAAALGISTNAAAQRVHRARVAGLLGPATRGRWPNKARTVRIRLVSGRTCPACHGTGAIP